MSFIGGIINFGTAVIDLYKRVFYSASSPNGFTARDLVLIGTRAGLRVRAALLTDPTALPVPCVVHLSSEHFVMLSEQRGAFYKVYDTLVPGSRWLTAGEVTREATGCVLMDDAVPLPITVTLRTLDLPSADAYRGRCHGPISSNDDDNHCVPDPSTCSTCWRDGDIAHFLEGLITANPHCSKEGDAETHSHPWAVLLLMASSICADGR